jgi:uncharacterized protein
MKLNMIIAAAAVMFAVSAQAQQVKVGTGGPKGTYHALFANIAEKCGSEMAMIEVPSSGSLENLDRLTGKEIGAAFMQTDALFASAQGRDLGNVKTLVAFNKEAVHVVALSASGMKSGGIAGFGGKEVVFNTVDELAGMKVAAAGGSLITAQLVRMQGQVNWTVVPAKTNDEALAQLKSGAVQAVMMVGGQPFGDVKALGPEFKLVGFKGSTVELLKTVYVPDRLSYPKLSQSAVSTIATEALLVTRTYNTPDKLNMLASFRNCVYTNIPVFQDADGAHPAWAQVSAENKGKWQYYDLPAPTASAAPVAAPQWMKKK